LQPLCLGREPKARVATKVVELFQTMAIVNLDMGNSNMEVSGLKNRLAIREKEKAILHEELDKENFF